MWLACSFDSSVEVVVNFVVFTIVIHESQKSKMISLLGDMTKHAALRSFLESNQKTNKTYSLTT